MKLTIFGTGYVGLVTGTCLAEVGHEVMCIDIDKKKIENLKKGILPIYEPGLEHLVIRNYKEGRLKFSTDAKEGINYGLAIFSAVGTPPDDSHKADLRFVKQVAKTFGENIDEYKIFINKSTVPVGTGAVCEKIIKDAMKDRGKKIKFDVVSNPEFLREGTAVRDFMAPNRIVCGTIRENAKEILSEIYKPFIRADRPLYFTDIKSSEVIKYAANSFLATKISFINEIANFAEIVGANIGDISMGIGLDERIGSKFLHAGIGYGGSCFPKDVQALIETGKENGYDFKILNSVEKVNKEQKAKVIEKLKKYIKNIKGIKVAIWGLSFKPRTDDIREAPSLTVIEKLLQEQVGDILVFDPVAMDNVKQIYGDEKSVIFTENYYDTVKNADVLLILTEWDEFRMPDFDRIKKLMKGNVIIDGRNIWNKDQVQKLGFRYEGIGK